MWTKIIAKMCMKVFSLLAASAIIAMSSTQAMAGGYCGSGLITHIKEGFWNEEGFVIHIDDSISVPTLGTMHKTDYVRFPITLNADRYRGIKALAYMAFSSGHYVTAYSSGATCAEEIASTIYSRYYLRC